jgi:hypothetical protein
MLKTSYSALLWAAEKYLARSNAGAAARLRALREEIRRECGASSAWMARTLGPLLLWTTRREQRRLDRGITYEPKTFLQRKNWSPAR